jgi:hypothetical protein
VYINNAGASPRFPVLLNIPLIPSGLAIGSWWNYFFLIRRVGYEGNC